MFLGALVTWWWVPEVQEKTGTNITLEELAKGRQRLADVVMTTDEDGTDAAV